MVVHVFFNLAFHSMQTPVDMSGIACTNERVRIQPSSKPKPKKPNAQALNLCTG